MFTLTGSNKVKHQFLQVMSMFKLKIMKGYHQCPFKTHDCSMVKLQDLVIMNGLCQVQKIALIQCKIIHSFPCCTSKWFASIVSCEISKI